ncbi:MAG: diguanylate cyclase [Klenkia sp.]|nr:diguanylate cyclase [Klenkia sp.]
MTPLATRTRDADRAAAVVFLGAAALLPFLLLLRPPPGGLLAASLGWLVVVLLGGLGAAAGLLPHRLPARTWPVMAVGGVVVVVALRPLFPGTPSLGFSALSLLVLFASSWLDRTTARVVTGGAVVAVTVIGATTFEPVLAVLHVLFVAGALVLLHVLLVRTRDAQAELVETLHRLASVDEVTGLVSRTAFRPAAHVTVEDAVRAGRDIALVLVDVDDFKSVNDRFGHPVGDAALQHLAEVLRGAIRTEDAVIGRLGGDELALLLPGCTRAVGVARVQELLAVVRQSPLALPGGGRLPLRVSVGLAVAPDHGRSYAELYAAADGALYEAKRSGRDRAAVA